MLTHDAPNCRCQRKLLTSHLIAQLLVLIWMLIIALWFSDMEMLDVDYCTLVSGHGDDECWLLPLGFQTWRWWMLIISPFVSGHGDDECWLLHLGFQIICMNTWFVTSDHGVQKVTFLRVFSNLCHWTKTHYNYFHLLFLKTRAG